MQHKTMVKKAKWALKQDIISDEEDLAILEELITSSVPLTGKKLEEAIQILKEE